MCKKEQSEIEKHQKNVKSSKEDLINTCKIIHKALNSDNIKVDYTR